MTNSENIEVKIPPDQTIPGTHPIIIIGPNGSGKTTFGSQLAIQNNAEWIPATRNLEFADSIPMQTTVQAQSVHSNSKNKQRNEIWRQANDLINLLAKLKAEENEEAIAFKRAYRSGKREDPPLTKIENLTGIWNSLFPKREINFSSYSPKVKANHRTNPAPFAIGRMSGGERVALYLLARIIDAPIGIIVIDEPELHFHGVLARKFWNALEILRTDCRFVYITHDLPFALSRNNPQFIIVTSESNHQILPPQTNIPDEIIESVLGAASFSISAKNFIFCEGSKLNKKDNELYSAWLQDDNTVIIPVGSCEEVIKCVEVFNSNEAVIGLQAKGIIDRDFRSDEFLSQLPENIQPLSLHEIESLYCTKNVYAAVAKYMGVSAADIETAYKNFISQVKQHFISNPLEKNKIILERTRQRTEEKSKSLLNGLHTETNIDIVKSSYLAALNITNWSFSPENYFDEEKTRVETVLEEAATAEQLLIILPGKTLFSRIINSLGITQESFLNLVISALNTTSEIKSSPLKTLKTELIAALHSHKPFQE
ncbi:MAG: AAA family ATPase [Candidatus Gracilibacteria bacterium]|nr:AAA family ATPase [Candidatus Gracilibacteria bacterium]